MAPGRSPSWWRPPCQQETTDEADLPAQYPSSCPQARLPEAHAYPCRPGDYQRQAPEGPSPPVGL